MRETVIELRCACGATARFVDEKVHYVTRTDQPDERGRRFRIEVWSDDWQERHEACLRPTGTKSADAIPTAEEEVGQTRQSTITEASDE